MPDVNSADVLVIGGGVLGCAVAERLSRTTAKVILIESESDVAEHASKGNAGVAVSYYGAPGLQQTDLINATNPMWEEIAGRLHVPYRRMGGLMVGLNDEQAHHLVGTLVEIHECGVRAELVDPHEARKLEPLVTPNIVQGMWMPDEGIIDPLRLTTAYASLAAQNGVVFRLSETVTSIEHQTHGSLITTNRGQINARFIVNAAGVAAAAISEMAGGEKFTTVPRKGQYVVLDRSYAHKLSTIVFSTHSSTTKGSNVVPTTHGSALLGPTAQDHMDPEDKSTDTETIEWIISNAAKLVPSTIDAPVIKTFAANRPAGDEVHRLRIDSEIANLLHVTDRSAGVSISPAAAEMALQLLKLAGLDVEESKSALSVLPKISSLRLSQNPEELIKENPLYGQVVCACEFVSAAEIQAALVGPVSATSIDGVRKRTGAGYGRCQGSLCLAGISFLTAVATESGPNTVLQTARGTLGS
ncbi:MAG: FAD-dependent oxidoreductase [Actinobacteria bacterium]|uniref:Unannotated protein n=1 Tax=freshwater metagenome TaxID=449393 RepID=A0A6J5Z2P1_9ZZZZ|nr:FAD-dependent oxidoreductase [Actinomycetota bacterium]